MQTPTQTPERTAGRRAIGGILILLGLLALAILIISLDEIIAGRVETVDITAELPEAEGLVAGNLVWIAGHEVGEVVSVTLLAPSAADSSRVIAVARIPRDHLSMLREDSRADITRRGLMGDPVLDFEPGSAGAPLLGPEDTVEAVYGPDRVGQALASARRTVGQIDSLVTSLRAVTALYRARRPMIDRVVHSMDEVSVQMERTALAFETGPIAAMRDARIGERFRRVRAALATAQDGLSRYTGGAMGEQIAAVRTRADSLRVDLATLDSLAGDPAAGFIGRMQGDSALGVATARASAQMDTLVQEVMSNPFMFF